MEAILPLMAWVLQIEQEFRWAAGEGQATQRVEGSGATDYCTTSGIGFNLGRGMTQLELPRLSLDLYLRQKWHYEQGQFEE